jgi:hypothetical protein
MAALASSTSSGDKTPRIIKNPFRSNKYRSASVISIGYSILGADAEISVALFSKVAVVLNVACSREVDVDVDVNVDLESPVADPVTELESARMALAAVEAEVLLIETAALFLLVDAKAKARTAGVSWRLVKHNIQRNMDRMFRVVTKGTATGAED